MDPEILKQNATQAARLLRALSNEKRLLVLCQLIEGEKSVTQLCRLVGTGQSAMSQHLARLRRDGLVQPRRQAQAVYYSVCGGEALRILDVLHEVYCQPRPGLPQNTRTSEALTAESPRAGASYTNLR